MTPSARTTSSGSRVVTSNWPGHGSPATRSALWALLGIGLLVWPAIVHAQNVVVDVTDITVAAVDDGPCANPAFNQSTFEVSLDANPGGPVIVDITVSNPLLATVVPVPLNFDAANFDVPQQVTVTALGGPFVGTIDLAGPAGGATINLAVVQGPFNVVIGTEDNRPIEWGLMSDGADVLSLSVCDAPEGAGEDCDEQFLCTNEIPRLPMSAVASITVLAGDGNDFVTAIDMGDDACDVAFPLISIYGQGGNDTLQGSVSSDFIEGGTGSDLIIGTLGNDMLNGDDAVLAGVPTDFDTLSYAGYPGDEGVSVNLGAPRTQEIADFVGLNPEEIAPVGRARTASECDGVDFNFDTIVEATQLPPSPPYPPLGTVYSFEEVLGTEEDDVLIGQAVRGMTLSAGKGDDKIVGGGGPDILSGGDDNDRVHGGNESPLMRAFCLRIQFADPVLDGILNPNRPYSDQIAGGDGDDAVNGGAGNDIVSGGLGNDQVIGGDDSDLLLGGEGDDSLSGGNGNDVLSGGLGNDTYSGGGGFDLADYQGSGPVTINLGAASEAEIGTAPRTGLDGLGAPQGTDSYPDDSLEAVRGTGDRDRLAAYLEKGTVLLGGGDDDTLYGGLGSDYIFGEFGNDIIIGEGELPFVEINENNKATSRDFIYGGYGNDTIRATSASDWIFGDGDELPDEDFNFIPDFEIAEPCDPLLRPTVLCDEFAPTNKLNPRLQDIRLYISLTELTRQPTQLQIPGPAGSDEIHGYPGSDIIIGGNSGDLIYGCAAIDPDLLGEGSIYPQGCLADVNTGIGVIDSDIIFGDLHTEFTGSAANLVILQPWTAPGPLGADTIHAGPRTDWVIGGNGPDLIYGDGGSDTLWGDFQYDLDGDEVFDFDPDDPSVLAPFLSLMADEIHGGDGTDLADLIEFTADGPDFIIGGPGDDFLSGDADADRIQGNSGFDIIIGGTLGDGLNPPSDSSLGDVVDYTTARVQGEMPEGQYGGVVVDLGFSNNVDPLSPDPATALIDHCTGASFVRGRTCNDGDLADPIAFPDPTVRGADVLFGIDHAVGTMRDDVIIGTNDRLDDVLAFVDIANLPRVALLELNRIVGSSTQTYDNMLFGLDGNDVLMGRLGNDMIIGGKHDDRICGDNDERCDAPNVLDPFTREAGDNDFLVGLSGEDTIYANGGDDVVRGGTGADFLSGGHGEDMLDYSDFTQPVIINLRTAEDINVRQVEQVLDAVLGDIRHSRWLDAYGVEPLFSNAADDDDLPQPLTCGAANVQCAGTATEPGGFEPGTNVPIPPALDTIINPETDNPNTSFDESLDRFERIMGTAGDDLIFAPEKSFVKLGIGEPHRTPVITIIGGGGDDRIFGAYDPDNIINYVIYGDGPLTADLLAPGQTLAGFVTGSDYIEGGLGDDFFHGGPTPECVLGVGGIETCPFGDIVSYAGSPAGVTIDMAVNTAQNTGGAGTDTVDGFQNIIGSAQNDKLHGNDFNNFLYGGPGDDEFFGNVGDDEIHGGGGDDVADYRSFPNLINPNEFVFAAGANPGEWIVGQDGQSFLPKVGSPARRFGHDELFGIDDVLVPSVGGPNTGGGGGGGSVPAPVQVTIGEDVEIQPGGSVVLSFSAIGGVPPYTAKWDPTTIMNTSVNPPRKDTILFWDESTSFTEGQVVQAQASPLSTMTFRVTVKDSIGTVDEEFIKVTVADTLEVTAGPDRVIALGETATFAPGVSGGIQPYTYLWSALSGDGGFVTATTVARAQVSPEVTTTYSLQVTDALGTTGFDTVEVRVSNPADGDGTVFVPDPDLDGTQQNPGDPDDDTVDDDTDDSNDDSSGGTPQQPQTPTNNNPAPAWCGAGMGSGLMAVNLFALAVMRRRRRFA